MTIVVVGGDSFIWSRVLADNILLFYNETPESDKAADYKDI